jgi:hypothetical protein
LKVRPMILNSYTVLDVALSCLRLLVAVLIVWLGLGAVRRLRRPMAPDARAEGEDQIHLLGQLARLLLGLQLVSWILLYLLLQSYVPAWPGVMCVYGVTRIGTASVGAARFLPALIDALQVCKPLLLFCGGAWLTLDRINRGTSTGPLTRRALAALIVLGLLGGADAAAELVYLLIPKKEEFPDLGCCTGRLDKPPWGRPIPDAVRRVWDCPWHLAGYAAADVIVVFALVGYLAQLRRTRRASPFPAVLPAAVAALPVAASFFSEVVAPIFLGLPCHHCPYDLLPVAPDAVLAAALFLGGTFAVGWACLAGWWADCADTRPFLYIQIGRVLGWGLFCYLGSTVLIVVGLAVA